MMEEYYTKSDEANTANGQNVIVGETRNESSPQKSRKKNRFTVTPTSEVETINQVLFTNHEFDPDSTKSIYDDNMLSIRGSPTKSVSWAEGYPLELDENPGAITENTLPSHRSRFTSTESDSEGSNMILRGISSIKKKMKGKSEEDPIAELRNSMKKNKSRSPNISYRRDSNKDDIEEHERIMDSAKERNRAPDMSDEDSDCDARENRSKLKKIAFKKKSKERPITPIVSIISDQVLGYDNPGFDHVESENIEEEHAKDDNHYLPMYIHEEINHVEGNDVEDLEKNRQRILKMHSQVNNSSPVHESVYDTITSCSRVPLVTSLASGDGLYSEVYVGKNDDTSNISFQKQKSIIHLQSPVFHKIVLNSTKHQKRSMFRMISVTKEGILCKLAYIDNDQNEKIEKEDTPDENGLKLSVNSLLRRQSQPINILRHRLSIFPNSKSKEHDDNMVMYHDADAIQLLFVPEFNIRRRSLSMNSLDEKTDADKPEPIHSQSMEELQEISPDQENIQSPVHCEPMKKRRHSFISHKVSRFLVSPVTKSDSIPHLMKLGNADACDDVHQIKKIQLTPWTYKTILMNVTENLEQRNGQTFLMVACELGKAEIVQELLSQTLIDVNAVDNDNWTAMLNAAKAGHHVTVNQLINAGALVEHRDIGGWTALMWACYKNRIDVCRVLLDNGANPNVKGEHHMSCLTWAAGRGYKEIVEMLLLKGAQVNTADKYGTTPLIWAARKGHEDIVDMLLQDGASVDNAGMFSWTALIVAAKAGYNPVVDSLLRHHPNVNATDKDGFTALTWAAKEGHSEIVNKLLVFGAYVNPPDRNGDTILIHAAKGGHIEVVRALLKKCADVDVEGVDHKTALYWAAEKGHVQIAKALLEYNANTEIANKDSDTSLLKAIVANRNNDTDSDTPLLKAVRNRNYDMVKAMMDKNAKVSTQDKKGDTALHMSVRARSKRITELLLRNPKDGRLLYKPNKAGETPYQIDATHEKRLLTQVYGARNLNADDNIQGYELYSSTIADVLSEPSLHTPINVGLYAKWGSGKSFLISKLIREMKAFTEHSTDPVYGFSWLLLFASLLLATVIGLVIGFASRWEAGLGVGLVLLFFMWLFFVIVYIGTTRHEWDWADNVGNYLAAKLQYSRLLLQLVFCNEPGRPNRETAAVKFLFTDNARLASVVGEKFITAMIGTLCEALEKEYGAIVTRLYKVFRPKRASEHGRFKSICCIPYFLVVIFLLMCVAAIVILLAIFGVHSGSSSSFRITDSKYTVVDSVLLGLGIAVALALIVNGYTWVKMIVSIAVPAGRRVQKIANSLDHSVKIDGFLQTLKKEVELLSRMTRCMDAFLNTHTRLVVIVDGLDSCEQDKLLQVLDTVHMLFGDSDSPFITILAVDPHVIIKGIEQNLTGLFRDSSINGHDYLRNIVQLPFFLQTQALPRPRTREDSSMNLNVELSRRPTMREDSQAGPSTSKKYTRTDSQSSKRFYRQGSILSSSVMSFSDEMKGRRSSRKNRASRQESFNFGSSNLTKQPSTVDLSKSLGKNAYFSDVNPRNMKRLMNIIAVTGRLLRANKMELNWHKLAAWVNITEQWPYRLSWVILEVEDNEDITDSQTLKTIYDEVVPKMPPHKDIDPLLEIDRNERKLEFFLTNHMPILTVGDMRKFLPCTINVDPYLRKLIREMQQNAEASAAAVEFSMGLGPPPAGTVDPASTWPYRPRPGSRMERESPSQRMQTPSRPASVMRGAGTFSPAHQPMAYQPPPPPGYGYMPMMPPGGYYTPTPQSTPGPTIAKVIVKGGAPEQSLSTLTVDGICSLMENVEGLTSARLPDYMKQIQENNISGAVLAGCDLTELKAILHMNFGDWEIFRSLMIHLREKEQGSDEFELTAPNTRFTQLAPQHLYTPQAQYAAALAAMEDPMNPAGRRLRHGSGGKLRQPIISKSNLQQSSQPFIPSSHQEQSVSTQDTPISGDVDIVVKGPSNKSLKYNSQKPNVETVQLHTRSMSTVSERSESAHNLTRKDSFLGEVMMEQDMLRGIVEAAGVDTDSESDNILEEEEEGEETTVSYFPNYTLEPYVEANHRNHSKSPDAESKASFSVGYRSTDDDSDDPKGKKKQKPSVKSGKRKMQVEPASSNVMCSLENNGVAASVQESNANDNHEDVGTHTPLLANNKESKKQKTKGLFSKKSSVKKKTDKKDNSAPPSGVASQRTSVGSSILSPAEMEQMERDVLGNELAELSDFDPVLTPGSSAEYLALRMLSQKEDVGAPSAFKSVTPGSSRASSRASSSLQPSSLPKGAISREPSPSKLKSSLKPYEQASLKAQEQTQRSRSMSIPTAESDIYGSLTYGSSYEAKGSPTHSNSPVDETPSEHEVRIVMAGHKSSSNEPEAHL